MSSDILDRIVAVKREELGTARAARSLASWREEAVARHDLRDFAGALRAKVAADRMPGETATDYVRRLYPNSKLLGQSNA